MKKILLSGNPAYHEKYKFAAYYFVHRMKLKGPVRAFFFLKDETVFIRITFEKKKYIISVDFETFNIILHE